MSAWDQAHALGYREGVLTERTRRREADTVEEIARRTRDEVPPETPYEALRSMIGSWIEDEGKRRIALATLDEIQAGAAVTPPWPGETA